MPSEPERTVNVKDLWQNQEREGVPMSVEEIRFKAGSFSRKIGWRNAREYFAALAVIVFFGFNFTRTQDLLTRVGFGLMIAGTAYVVGHLYAHGSRRRLPEDLGLANCVQFHRAELSRQRDLLMGVWRWYLGPLIPGLVVLMVAVGRTNPGNVKHFALIAGLYDVVVVLVFVFIWWLNRRGAHRLQARIDELDALDELAA